MKQQTFIMAHEQARERCIACVANIPADGKTEVLIRDARIGKTMQQLGALFGLWVTYISNETGLTEDQVHAELKANFLRRVYLEEPHGDIQEMWVDLYYRIQEQQDWEMMRRHRATISLSWSTLNQMKRYLELVRQYFIGVGKPLPIPDPEWRSHGEQA